MAGLLLWCEMTIIKTIAPHLENILMQNTAQDSQETSFETALNSNRVLCLCPALVYAYHQKAVNSRGRVSGTVSIRETKGAASMGKKEKTAGVSHAPPPAHPSVWVMGAAVCSLLGCRGGPAPSVGPPLGWLKVTVGPPRCRETS